MSWVLGLVGNRAEAIAMLFTAAKLGAVWIPVNAGLRGAFLQHQLHNAEPRVVVVRPPGTASPSATWSGAERHWVPVAELTQPAEPRG